MVWDDSTDIEAALRELKVIMETPFVIDPRSESMDSGHPSPIAAELALRSQR